MKINRNRPDFKNFSKKQLKDYVNEHGFFSNALIDKSETNAPAGLADQIPDNAIYFKAIASNGDLNRNGYIIREKALKAAISQYMNNPIILLQHDMNQPVGKVLRAQGSQEGIMIEGYIYDEYTNGRFSKGLFNAVSTGHLTEAVEFENEETQEVISEEKFRALSWEEKQSDKWIMAVTALDWLENSIVSIGANRKSLVKNKDLVKNYIEALKNEVEEVKEKMEKKEEIEAEKVDDQKETEPTEKSADEKEVVEMPPAEDGKAENAVKSKESVTLEVSQEEVKQVNEALFNLAKLAESQKAEIASLKSQVDTLKNALDNIPVRKGLVVTQNTFSLQKEKVQPKESWLKPLLEANGIHLNQ